MATPDADVVRRPRRTCLLVPGHRAGQLEHAARVPADEVVLDIGGLDGGDADIARGAVVDALRTVDYGDRIVSVRISPLDAAWAYRDVVDVVEHAGDFLDCVTVPGVRAPADVEFVDTLLRMVSERIDIAHTIGIEAGIDSPAGVALLDDVVVASDRLDALVWDVDAIAAELSDDGGSTPDTIEPLTLRALVAARAGGLQIVLGAPRTTDTDIVTARARRARTLGLDGVWCTHPRQVAPAAAA